MKAEKGMKVKIEYTGTLEDGSVFDASEKHGAPLEFTLGSGQIIRGLDEAIVGMEVGEEKKVRIGPKDAYGDRNPEMLKSIPKDKIQGEQEPKAGMALMVGLPDGNQFPAKIVEVKDSEIIIDLNHPLAGKALSFSFKLVDAEKVEPGQKASSDEDAGANSG